jgi:hypothetical protein
MGVVDWVHGDTAHLGALAQPAGATGLADGHILMVDVPNLSYGGNAILKDHPYLTGGEFHLGIFPFLVHQLGKCAGTASKLSPLADLQLDIVDNCAERDRSEW